MSIYDLVSMQYSNCTGIILHVMTLTLFGEGVGWGGVGGYQEGRRVEYCVNIKVKS